MRATLDYYPAQTFRRDAWVYVVRGKLPINAQPADHGALRAEGWTREEAANGNWQYWHTTHVPLGQDVEVNETHIEAAIEQCRAALSRYADQIEDVSECAE